MLRFQYLLVQFRTVLRRHKALRSPLHPIGMPPVCQSERQTDLRAGSKTTGLSLKSGRCTGRFAGIRPRREGDRNRIFSYWQHFHFHRSRGNRGELLLLRAVEEEPNRAIGLRLSLHMTVGKGLDIERMTTPPLMTMRGSGPAGSAGRGKIGIRLRQKTVKGKKAGNGKTDADSGQHIPGHLH